MQVWSHNDYFPITKRTHTNVLTVEFENGVQQRRNQWSRSRKEWSFTITPADKEEERALETFIQEHYHSTLPFYFKDLENYQANDSNLLLWTEDFTNTVWSLPTGTHVYPNVTHGPYRSMNADRIDFPSGVHGPSQSVTVAITPLTFSVWLKADSPGNTFIGWYDGTTQGAWNYTQVDVTTQWQRFSMSFTPASSNVQVGVHRSGTGVSLDHVYAWGAQLEKTIAGFSPSSYNKNNSTRRCTIVQDNATTNINLSKKYIIPLTETIWIGTTQGTRNVDYTIDYDNGTLVLSSAPSTYTVISSTFEYYHKVHLREATIEATSHIANVATYHITLQEVF